MSNFLSARIVDPYMQDNRFTPEEKALIEQTIKDLTVTPLDEATRIVSEAVQQAMQPYMHQVMRPTTVSSIKHQVEMALESAMGERLYDVEIAAVLHDEVSIVLKPKADYIFMQFTLEKQHDADGDPTSDDPE